MRYDEFIPGPLLRPFVRLVWSLCDLDNSTGSNIERIVPDGCPEVVINCGDRFQRIDQHGARRTQAEVLLVGQIERAIEIVPSGAIDLIGIRFEPGGLHALLGIPMHELVGEDFCLGQAQLRLRDELAAVGAFRDLILRVELIESILTRWFTGRRVGYGGRSSAGLIGAAIGAIESGVTSTDRLSAVLGINRRSLERSFRKEVGLSPKVFARIHRLQTVLRRLDSGFTPRSWAELAFAHGYSDQSHLIREFRLLAGLSPERYLADRTAFATCFETGELSHSSNAR